MDRFYKHLGILTGILLVAGLFLGFTRNEDQNLQESNMVWRVCTTDAQFHNYRSEVVRPTGETKRNFGRMYWRVFHVMSDKSFWIAKSSLCESHVKADAGIVVDTKNNTLTLVYGSNRVKKFAVGTGKHKEGYRSPHGMFRVNKKEKCPLYYGDTPTQPVAGCDESNPLGASALWFLGRNYGIHGTNRPELISRLSTRAEDRRVSKGCFRMNNKHVRWLSKQVRVGSPVWATYGAHREKEGGHFKVIGQKNRKSSLMVRLDAGTAALHLTQRSTGAHFVIEGGDALSRRYISVLLPVGSTSGNSGFIARFEKNSGQLTAAK